MNNIKETTAELRNFLILWFTQMLSTLGSSMTNFALVIWLYQQTGSALSTAMLTICSYAPYVAMSIFAGALSDKWNKKLTMLVSDSGAAVCTVFVLVLFLAGRLSAWHLYCLNALNGLMNTVQQPASDVAISLITPKKHYQKISGLRALSQSLVSVLTPVIATALLSFTSLKVVIMFDLASFCIAFICLAFFIKIPEVKRDDEKQEKLLQSAKEGLGYLKNNRGIFSLIMFLAAINLIASVYNAAFPAMVLSKPGGGQQALGIVNTAAGIAMVAGSLLASALPAPKNRVRVICNALLVSMSTENLFLALGRTVPVWCFGAVLGWLPIPVMNANMDVLFRTQIPVEMQGRVYSVRNTLQFFTIPLGYLLGGFLVDKVFEPFMAAQQSSGSGYLQVLFGTGKGSGAAMLFMLLWLAGIFVCLAFRKNKHIWRLENKKH